MVVVFVVFHSFQFVPRLAPLVKDKDIFPYLRIVSFMIHAHLHGSSRSSFHGGERVVFKPSIGVQNTCVVHDEPVACQQISHKGVDGLLTIQPLTGSFHLGCHSGEFGSTKAWVSCRRARVMRTQLQVHVHTPLFGALFRQGVGPNGSTGDDGKLSSLFGCHLERFDCNYPLRLLFLLPSRVVIG